MNYLVTIRNVIISLTSILIFVILFSSCKKSVYKKSSTSNTYPSNGEEIIDDGNNYGLSNDNIVLKYLTFSYEMDTVYLWEGGS